LRVTATRGCKRLLGAKQGTFGLTASASVGSPEDVGNVVVFLASDEASYAIGEVINVSGGMTL